MVQHLRVKTLLILWVVSSDARWQILVCMVGVRSSYRHNVPCLDFWTWHGRKLPFPSHLCHSAHSLLTLLWPTCPAGATPATESLLARKRSKPPLKIQQCKSPSRRLRFSSSGHDNRNSVGHKPQKVESCASISWMSFVVHPKPLARALFSLLYMFFHDF